MGPGEASGPPDRRLAVPSPEADELVESAVAGDADAFAALYRATLPVVYQAVFGRCGQPALAEDVTAEAFLRAMRSISRFSGSSRDFVAWVHRIARNAFLDHVKSARVRWEVVVEELPPAVATSDPESEAVGRVEAGKVREALSALTPDQQEVIYLRFLRDLSIAEVAEIVGRNEGAVKALQFRALRALARLLAGEAAGERGRG